MGEKLASLWLVPRGSSKTEAAKSRPRPRPRQEGSRPRPRQWKLRLEAASWRGSVSRHHITGVGTGCSPPQKIWDFFTWNGPFWCNCKFSCIWTEMLGNLLLGPQQLQYTCTAGGWGGFDRTSRTPSLRVCDTENYSSRVEDEQGNEWYA